MWSTSKKMPSDFVLRELMAKRKYLWSHSAGVRFRWPVAGMVELLSQVGGSGRWQWSASRGGVSKVVKMARTTVKSHTGGEGP